MRHIIDLSELPKKDLIQLLSQAGEIMSHPDDYRDACRGRVMGTLFYEPSTRTCFSFQTAMMRLGGSIFGFSDPGSSSVSKGETLKDTVIMCAGYADALVIRHPKEGAARAASLYSDVPVINAGDGGHLHPTQTLTDLTTMTLLRGGFTGMNIGLCGDLKNGRTVHSLIKTLAAFSGITYYLISPEELRIPGYLRTFMQKKNLRFFETSSMESVMPQLDVLYMTRIQKERFLNVLEYERLRGVYVLTSGKLRSAKKDLLILHPLPRVDEIAQEVDNDPRAAYFKQARCGMFARMALLLRQISLGRKAVSPFPDQSPQRLCMNPGCIVSQEPYLSQTIVEGRCIYCDKEILSERE